MAYLVFLACSILVAWFGYKVSVLIFGIGIVCIIISFALLAYDPAIKISVNKLIYLLRGDKL